MHDIVQVIHIVVSASLIGLVLVQRGKGADAGASFGASQTFFGSSGSANFLTRLTAALATVFFLTSLGLAYYSRQAQKIDSVIEQSVPVEPVTAPAVVEKAMPEPTVPDQSTGEVEKPIVPVVPAVPD